MADEVQATESADTGSVKYDAAEARMHEHRLSSALAFKNHRNLEKRWRTYLRILGYNYYSPDEVDEDQPVVNIIAARIRSMPPKLAFNVPTFECKSVGQPPYPNSEAALAAWLQLTWRREGFDDVFRSCILDSPTFGIGIAYVGYESSDEGPILDQRRKMFAALGGQVAEKVKAIASKMGIKDGEPDVPREQQTPPFQLHNRIFLERVSPLDFFIDPVAKSWGDATFMGRKVYLPAARAKLMFGDWCPEATSIGNVGIAQEGSESHSEQADDREDSTLKSNLHDAVKRVAVWEMWDLTTRRTMYFDASTNRLIKGAMFEWKASHPGFPFVPLPWDEMPDRPFPEGLAAALHTPNNELNKIRKRELVETGKAWSKILAREGMSSEAINKLLSDSDEVILLDEEGLDSIDVLKFPELRPELFALEERIKSDMNEVSNTSSYDSASMPTVKRTATESSLVQSSSDAMMAFRQLMVEQAAAQIADRMLAFCFDVFDEPITVRFANMDPKLENADQPDQLIPVGEPINYELVGVEHAGYYETTVLSGSMASVAKDLERHQMSQIVQLYGGFEWFDVQAFATQHLSMFPTIKNPAQFIKNVAEMQPQMPQPPVNPPQDAGLQGLPAGGMMPADGAGPTSEADVMAAMFGGMAPNTGVNGFPGPIG